MRENNRKPIEKCIKKLPQFTTMNVIDGQAGLVIYSSLIFYSLTIDNILNIIVLLILAGVTLSTLVGDNGIITKAQEAKQNMANASAEEQQLIQNLVNSINAISEGGSGGIVTPPEPEPLPDPTDPDNWNPEKVIDVVTETVDGEELHAPIPDGFTASKVDGEDTISDGLVIYETEEEVNSSNHDIALTTYNQYVWIPVKEINDMVMCKSKTTDTQCHIIRVDDEGSPNGFYLKCETHNSTDLAGKLYEGRPDITDTDDGGMILTYEMDPNQTDQAYDPNSGSREPAIITGNSTGDGTQYDGASNNYHGLANAQAFLTQLNNDFNDMVKSVYTYGGFYVGRYEMGEGGSTKKGQTVLTAEGDSGNMWYGLYNVARQKGEAINREMIWRMPV